MMRLRARGEAPTERKGHAWERRGAAVKERQGEVNARDKHIAKRRLGLDNPIPIDWKLVTAQSMTMDQRVVF